MKGSQQLVNAWKLWQGKIYCGYSKGEWSADKLREESALLKQNFQQQGIQRGDIVAMSIGNHAYFPVCLLALLELGANPLLLHVSCTSAEVDKLREEIPIQYLCHDFIYGLTKWYDEKKDFLPCLESSGIEIGIKKYALNDKIQRQQDLYGVVLHPTSGTYGAPGICLRNQDVAINEGQNYLASIELYKKVRIAVTTPLSHAFAYGFGLVSAFLSHSSIELNVKFNPRKLLKGQLKRPSQIIMLVPPMMKALLILKKQRPEFILQGCIFYAGTSCDSILLREFEDEFNIKVYTIYGTTETGAIASNYPDASIGGVGKCLKNVNILLANKDKYKGLKDQQCEIGDVKIKSTSMMQRYWNSSENLSRNLFFTTGDLGHLKHNEEIFLVGRSKDVINIGGLKVDPREVEDLLIGCRGVLDVSVYAGIIEQRGSKEKIVAAALEVDKDLYDEGKIRQFLSEKLNPFKIPRLFFILDSLPRTASGKCLKIQLPSYAE